MWKNIIELDRPRMAIWRKCIACGLTKAKDTLSEYVTFVAFPLQQLLGERTSMLLPISEFPHHSLSFMGRKIK